MMSCEGVWRVEMLGAYGWENVGTAYMRNGEYFEASANYYSVGRYKVDGDNLEISDVLTQYGQVRTIFGGNSREKTPITSKCKIKENEITGRTNMEGIEELDIRIRLIRLESF